MKISSLDDILLQKITEKPLLHDFVEDHTLHISVNPPHSTYEATSVYKDTNVQNVKYTHIFYVSALVAFTNEKRMDAFEGKIDDSSSTKKITQYRTEGISESSFSLKKESSLST